MLAWLLTFYLTRTSSLAALIATPLTLPLLAWQEPQALVPMSVLTLLIVWRHRGNLRDLFAGRERHFKYPPGPGALEPYNGGNCSIGQRACTLIARLSCCPTCKRWQPA